MSRSYKKTPIYKDNGIGKTARRASQKAVRKLKISEDETFSSKSNYYRKLYLSYNLHDYVSYWTKEDAVAAYYEEEKWQQLYTLEEFLEKVWASSAKRK